MNRFFNDATKLIRLKHCGNVLLALLCVPCGAHVMTCDGWECLSTMACLWGGSFSSGEEISSQSAGNWLLLRRPTRSGGETFLHCDILLPVDNFHLSCCQLTHTNKNDYLIAIVFFKAGVSHSSQKEVSRTHPYAFFCLPTTTILLVKLIIECVRVYLNC